MKVNRIVLFIPPQATKPRVTALACVCVFASMHTPLFVDLRS